MPLKIGQKVKYLYISINIAKHVQNLNAEIWTTLMRAFKGDINQWRGLLYAKFQHGENANYSPIGLWFQNNSGQNPNMTYFLDKDKVIPKCIWNVKWIWIDKIFLTNKTVN